MEGTVVYRSHSEKWWAELWWNTIAPWIYLNLWWIVSVMILLFALWLICLYRPTWITKPIERILKR